MRVIIIPCSGRKISGGASLPTSHVQPLLAAESWDSLRQARVSLAESLGIEAGPDLGDGNSSTLQLLPAWQRYDGNLYRKARLMESDIHRPGWGIFIVSALFGVISARDTIRHYNVAMTDRLPSGRRVNSFWRANGLGSILADLLARLNAREVHDFLSGTYRDAVRGLAHELPVGCEYFPRSYPGLGTGSDYHRGDGVRTLLKA
jgi:cytoplasmic iron level regulating protein YaaA (DUF328/UPF0246 family)